MRNDHTSLTEGTPAIEPATLAELLQYGRIDDGGDNTLVDDLITAARQQVETVTGRALISRSNVARWDKWPDDDLYLPRFPVTAVATVKYYNSDGTLTTWDTANYVTDLASVPARISRGYGVTWPTIRKRTGTIEVTYTAGYGATAATVPRALRIAVMAVALDMYERRDLHIESATIRDNPAIANLLAANTIPATG